MNQKSAILVVSFGTTHPDALQNSIASTEEAIAGAYPQHLVRRAFTSGMIIRILERRGVQIDTVEQALDRLAAEGIEEVLVQPTHILCGEEVQKLTHACRGKRTLFSSLKIAAPLLSSTEDFLTVVSILADAYPHTGGDTALVLMGHGSTHHANTAYAAMDYMFKEQGYPHAFVGAVEGYPGVETVLRQVKRGGFRKVQLAPLMLVAGDHAKNDMAGDEDDSWKNIFEQAGFEVAVSLRGLGEYPEIRQLYAAHVGAL